MILHIADLRLKLDGHTIVSDANLYADPGDVVGVVGPNGSGKSTLLKSIYRALRPAAGQVMHQGVDLWKLDARSSARRVSALPQEGAGDLEFTAAEVVLQGRTPYKRMFEQDGPSDWDIAADCLIRVGMFAEAHRSFATLSGGEKQRVLLARALAQQAPVLVLDEPTNHLDIAAQLDLLELVHDAGLTTIMAVHDLNHAAAHCDRVYVMDEGRIVAEGPPREVLTPDLIKEVFRATAVTVDNPITGLPQFLFSPLTRVGLRPEAGQSKGTLR